MKISDITTICTAPEGIRLVVVKVETDERTREVFPGCPEIRDGYMWPSESPGLGVDIDEDLAAKYPFPEDPLNGGWPPVRRLDGTVIRP
ncbi:MAG TPA: hypothetical protein VNT12_06000 [Rubrobacter sp.]|nr:hypothetical protein [Rubrobacter sp.]